MYCKSLAAVTLPFTRLNLTSSALDTQDRNKTKDSCLLLKGLCANLCSGSAKAFFEGPSLVGDDNPK